MPFIYLDKHNGNDANDGSTWALAKATIDAAILAVAVRDTTIRIASGSYITLGVNLNLAKYKGLELYGEGNVVVDGVRTVVSFLTDRNLTNIGITEGDEIVFVNILFKEFTGPVCSVSVNGILLSINCAFLNLSGPSDKIGGPAGKGNINQCCTVYQMRPSDYLGTTAAFEGEHYSSIWTGYTGVIAAGGATGSDNACDTVEIRFGGWDTGTYPSPFVDAPNGDVTFDFSHGQYGKYMEEGYQNFRMGATGRAAKTYLAFADKAPRLQLNNHDVLGNIENDERYYDTVGSTPGPEGPVDAAPTKFNSLNMMTVDLIAEPSGKSARGITQVIDKGGRYRFFNISFGALVSGPNVVDNSKDDIIRQLEYRAHEYTFNKYALPGSTDIGWTLIARVNQLTTTKPFIQFRIVARLDGMG